MDGGPTRLGLGDYAAESLGRFKHWDLFVYILTMSSPGARLKKADAQTQGPEHDYKNI